MENLPHEALKEIALHLYKGSIFSDRHIRSQDDLGMVFMPLLFMGEEAAKQMEDVGMIYEYMDKALPRSINGYPCFMSFHSLSKTDTSIVMRYYKAIEESFKNLEIKPQASTDEEQPI